MFEGICQTSAARIDYTVQQMRSRISLADTVHCARFPRHVNRNRKLYIAMPIGINGKIHNLQHSIKIKHRRNMIY